MKHHKNEIFNYSVHFDRNYICLRETNKTSRKWFPNLIKKHTLEPLLFSYVNKWDSSLANIFRLFALGNTYSAPYKWRCMSWFNRLGCGDFLLLSSVWLSFLMMLWHQPPAGTGISAQHHIAGSGEISYFIPGQLLIHLDKQCWSKAGMGDALHLFLGSTLHQP